MDNPQPGPSGIQRRRAMDTPQALARLDESDSDYDLDIPHVSDDSGSSSEEEDFTLNPEDFEEKNLAIPFWKGGT